MIHGPRTWISPMDVPSHGCSRPLSSTIRRSTPDRGVALLGPYRVLLLLRPLPHVALEAADGADRAHLRHPPGVHHRGAELLVEVLEQVRGAAEPPMGMAADGRDVVALALHQLLHRDPDGGHGAHERDLLRLDDLADVARLRVGAAEDLGRAQHRPGERHAPRVGVEHRHDVQDDVALGERERVGHAPGPGSARRARGACRRRPWGGRWCRTCSTCRRRRSRPAGASRPAAWPR